MRGDFTYPQRTYPLAPPIGSESNLCVGGPLNGQWVRQDGTSFVCVEQAAEMETWEFPQGSISAFTSRLTVYQSVLIGFLDNPDARIWVPKGQSPKDTLERLVGGFRP